MGQKIQAWDRELAAEKKRGFSTIEAIKNVVRRDPDLHAAYLREYNEEHAAARQPKAVEGAPIKDLKAVMPGASAADILKAHESGVQPAEAAWNAAVDKKMAAGLSQAEAIRAVRKENTPEFHAAYIRAYNARVGHIHAARNYRAV